MKKIEFTIKCKSNPVPYKRTTRAKKFVDTDYHRYLDWKEKVRRVFSKKFESDPEYILQKKTKYYLNITIYFKDLTHADSSNILKGIEDAIFQKPLNDKYIVPRVKDYYYDKENPRVEVEIIKANRN